MNVKITYYRNDENVHKTAIVSEKQLEDIKKILPWIHIMKVSEAPAGSKRSYCLE